MHEFEHLRQVLLNQLAQLQRELDDALSELVRLYHPVIAHEIRALNIQADTPLFEELESHARLAIVKRWRDYDPTRGAPTVFFRRVIRGALRHALRSYGYALQHGRAPQSLLDIDAPTQDLLRDEYYQVKRLLTDEEWDLLADYYLTYAHLPEEQRIRRIARKQNYRRVSDDDVRVMLTDALSKLESGISD